MRLGIGLGLFKQGAVSVGVRLFSAYKSRVIADGGTVEADNCGISALNNGLFRQASLLLIPSGYKSGKAYAEIPTNGNGDLTWTRASTALRTNSSGLLESMGSGVPRLSYMYGSCPALLLEPQRTNLALQSESFDSASWDKNSTTITANTTTSPDGNNTADTIDVSNSGGSFVRQTITVVANTSYTFSFYVKRGTATDMKYSVYNISGASNIIIPTSYYSQTNSSTWTRISVNFTTPVGCTSIYIYPSRDNASTGTFYLWGFQLELGAYATTYIPTTTASATRIADSFSRNNIYTNGLITSSGGTWFVELRGNVSYVRDTTTRLGIGDTTALTTNAIWFGVGATSSRLQIATFIATAGNTVYTTTANTSKIAIKWNGTTADIFENGTKVVSATPFTTTNMENFVTNGIGVPFFIQAMALYPTPLSDSQCIALTT